MRVASEPSALRCATTALGISFRSLEVKSGSTGKIEVKGRKWKTSKALCGEWVHSVALEQCVLVYDCATQLREVDVRIQTQSWCKGCLGTKCKHVLGLGTLRVRVFLTRKTLPF
jgi:hypothetical protein